MGRWSGTGRCHSGLEDPAEYEVVEEPAAKRERGMGGLKCGQYFVSYTGCVVEMISP